MRSVMPIAVGVIGVALGIALQPSLLRADDVPDCPGRCVLPVQYPYNGTPEQQYEERQREYREQQSEEQHQKALRDIQEGSQSGRGSGGSGAYGAIAYSPDSGDYGYSFSYSSRAGAERRAKRECGKTDCTIAAWFRNSCGALATGDDGTWAGGRGDSESAARRDAQSDCVKEGGKNCEVVHAQCSR